MELVCPHCQHGISSDHTRCQHCGNPFNSEDWPKEAYSVNGLTSKLSLKRGCTIWQPQTDCFLVGRNVGVSDFRLEHPSVSSEHVRITRKRNFWQVEKVGASFLWNGTPADSAILTQGGQLSLGVCLLNVDFSWQQEPPHCQMQGSLLTEETIVLKNLEMVKIGSDASQCQVLISGIAPLHAILYRHGKNREWWLVDCATDIGTFVNGEPRRNCQIYQEDTITIAGISLRFGNEELETKPFSTGFSSEGGLALGVCGLSAFAGHTAILENVHFSVKPGEFVGVLGPSGCGKSSLIQRLVGLGKYSSGQILVNNQSASSVQEQFLRETAYLPQQASLHENLTLEQECQTFCLLHASSLEQGKQNIRPALKMVGLENELHKRIGTLSGGQQRRAGIALELLRSPRLLILDEPTSGLDPATESDIMRYLRRIANQGKTVLCSTHLMENFEMFDKILLLSRGRTLFFGKPTELLRYFSAHRPMEIFRRLGEGTTEQQIETARQLADKFESSPFFKNAQAAPMKEPQPLETEVSVPLWREIWGYLKRYFDELFSFGNTQNPIASFLRSPFFLWFLLQPFLIAMAIKLSCAVHFYDVVSGVYLIFFLALLSMFWLGMTNSIREFVSERVPGRCLERLRQVSFSGYLLSKLLGTGSVCLLQTILFSLVFFGIPDFYVSNLGEFDTLCFHWSFGLSVVLFLTCILGSWTALAVSAFAKNESFAVGMLPLVLIPILLFSYPVMENDDTFDKNFPETCDFKYNKPAILLEWISPCHPPLVLMSHLNALQSQASSDGNDQEDRSRNMLPYRYMFINTIVWMTISLSFIIMLQMYNERSWEGR